jgi:hypothetical protein
VYDPPPAQVNLTIGSNTAGAGALVSTGTVTLAGGANITLSQNAGNAITIIAGGGGGGGINLAGSNTTYTSGTVSLTGVGGGITVSSNTGQRIDLSVAAQTVQTQNLVDLTLAGNSTSAGAGYILMSSGTVTLAGGPNITLSQAGNAISISGAPPATGTRSFLLQTYGIMQASVGAGFLSLQPLPVEWYLTCTEFDWLMSASQITLLSTMSLTASVGIWSWANTTSLALASSGSVSYTWGTGASGSYNAIRQWSCPLNAYMTPGDYVFGLHIRMSNLTLSILGESTFSFAGSAGVATATSAREFPGLGVFSSSFSTALPGSIVASQIGGQSQSGRMNDLILRALGA